MEDASKIMGEALTLVAADGYRLAATRYPAAGGEARAHLLLAGATGVPQGFYRRFAEYASQRGFCVLTLDYRGVGLSRPASLRGFEMSYLDWGRLDLAAAVEAHQSDRVPLYLVGHSFGGHALGLLPNHRLISACCSFGSGAGWAGWMPWLDGIKVRLLWNLILPPLVAWKGYMPWRLLGMGEDLPLSVYRDWKRWCRYPHYFFDDPEMADMRRQYAEVRLPLLSVTALDDPWAPPRSRDAFASGYRNAQLSVRDIAPPPAGEPIGHMGYFRAACRPLWDETLDWLVHRGQRA
ncbi:alpha/beta fold hydrolase [Chitinivorax sp. PXF-14]|uniref:alpha/beta hydrolase family protein n=1 Tax=Chitinivorax sp. PXF-14 TaxID=3230488 RepID=UPI00346672B3